MSREDSLPTWLRDLRLRATLTQAEVAAASEVGLRNVQRYESGASNPGGEEFLRLLSALSVDVTPRPPGDLYRSVNAEVHALREALQEAAGMTRAQHRKTQRLLVKLAETVASNSTSLLTLALRIEELERALDEQRSSRQRRSA